MAAKAKCQKNEIPKFVTYMNEYEKFRALLFRQTEPKVWVMSCHPQVDGNDTSII